MEIRLTIGICAYNEDKNIGHLLQRISLQKDLPEETEIIIVCSGCTDKTEDIVQKFLKDDSRIRLFLEPKRIGKAAAVNHILKKAKGNIILFISADTLPNNNCFSHLISRLSEEQVGIVCGKPVPIDKKSNFIVSMMKTLWHFHDRIFLELNHLGIARHASEVFAIRKCVTEKLPMEIVNDDAYMAVMAKKNGWFIKYEPKAKVYISVPKTFSEYLRQRRRIIFGHYQIKKITGTSPQYLIHLLPFYPKHVLKLAIRLLSHSKLWVLPIFVTVEIGLNLITIYDRISKKSYSTWEQCSTTKIVKQNL